MSNISSSVSLFYAYTNQGVSSSSYMKSRSNANGIQSGVSSRFTDTAANGISVTDKRRQLASANGTGAASGSSAAMKSSGADAIWQSSQQYSASLQTQRQQSSATSNKLKKLKYQFKNISSRIIRSKTSNAARQAASQARREYLRLKRERQSGEYDSEEIEAAIAHAKSMELVAKKKVKHLEEEEMLKAAGGICSDYQVDEDERKESDESVKASSDESSDDASVSAQNVSDAYNSESEFSLYESGEMPLTAQFGMGDMPDISDISSEIFDEMSDMYDDMSDEMKEMFEDMGLDELTDSLMAASKDTDPEDLKMMKIKHRNKEMRDIVKADSVYLKAMFDHYEKQKNSGSVTGMSSGSNVSAASAPAPTIGTSSNLSAAAVAASAGTASLAASPVIDVTL